MNRETQAAYRIQETRQNRLRSHRHGHTRNAAGRSSGSDTGMCFQCTCCLELIKERNRNKQEVSYVLG